MYKTEMSSMLKNFTTVVKERVKQTALIAFS